MKHGADHVVRASRLTKVFSSAVTAVAGLDLEVPRGVIFGLFGPNGAGKTTTVRLLNGVLSATSGTAEVLGGDPGAPDVRARVATLAELAAMYADMTVVENLRFYGALYGVTGAKLKQRIERMLARLRLEAHADRKLGTLSTGLAKRAQLARVLLTEPELVFLDEPTSGLDPDSAREVTGLVRSVSREAGTTVVLCTHDLHRAESVCDLFGFLRAGAVVASGNRDQVIESISTTRMVRITTTTGSRDVEYRDEAEIDALVRAERGPIVEVVRCRPTLEDAYFHHMGLTPAEGEQ